MHIINQQGVIMGQFYIATTLQRRAIQHSQERLKQMASQLSY
jgi:hypothetical protein